MSLREQFARYRWPPPASPVQSPTRRIIHGDVGTDSLLAPDRTLTELRTDDVLTRGREFYLSLNAAREIDATLLQSNIKLGDIITDADLESKRVPQLTGLQARNELFLDEVDTRQFELGLDAERYLTEDLNGKAILLFTRQRDGEVSTQRTLDVAGTQTAIRIALVICVYANIVRVKTIRRATPPRPLSPSLINNFLSGLCLG